MKVIGMTQAGVHGVFEPFVDKPRRRIISKNFQKALGAALIVGRVFGVFPHLNIANSWRSKDLVLSFRWLSWWTFYSCVKTVFSSFYIYITIWGEATKFGLSAERLKLGDVLGSLSFISFSVSASLIHVHYLYKAQDLSALIDKFIRTIDKVNLRMVDDKRFLRHSMCIIFTAIGFSIVENIFYDVNSIKYIDKPSYTQRYFIHLGGHFAEVVGDIHHVAQVLFIIFTKLMSHVSTCSDIFVVTLCHALATQFHKIGKHVTEKLQDYPGFTSDKHSITKEMEQKFWDKIRDKVINLSDLSEQVSSLVSPVIAICYVNNILCIIVHVFHWVTFRPNDSIEGSIYVYTSNLSFILRVALLTYYASGVYHSTEGISKILRRCSIIHFNNTAGRLEKLVDEHPAQIAILNSFPITRNFFLSIISLICTTEIVLLQTDNR